MHLIFDPFKLILRLLIVCTFLFTFQVGFAQHLIEPIQQQERPKIGLCLSGGGAKGMAHIGLLKAIDSLGIKIDYITGTSMGGIVGGLYAIGYSGKQLDSIARHIRWDEILSNKIALDYVNIDEKDEYGRFPLELPLNNKKIELPSGIVEGYELMSVLQALTFRVAHINNFDSLPIPFLCIGGDVVNGGPVILDHGNLAYALRASMSIPTLFTPVEYGDSLLLVDGGLFKNFPVDILCQKGVEFVIGGFTGGQLFQKEQLNSITKIMYQSASYSRVAESAYQKQHCDILADFNAELSKAGIDGGDFKMTDEILAIGDRVTQKILPQLQALADLQHSSAPIDTDVFAWRSMVAAANKNGLAVDSITTTIFRKTKGKPAPPLLSASKASELVDEYYGSQRYKQVDYSYKSLPDGSNVLHIRTIPQPRTSLRMGVHYDTELDASILGSLIVRDVLGKYSRLVLGADIGDNYKVRADYRIHLKESEWWLQSSLYHEKVTAPLYIEGRVYDAFHRRFFRANTGLNHTISRSSYIGLHFVVEDTGYRPLVRASNRSRPFVEGDTISGLVRAHYSVPGIELQYQSNKLDDSVFPTRGSRISFIARICTNTPVRFKTETVLNNQIVKEEERRDDVFAYAKLLVRWEKVYRIRPKVLIHSKIVAGARLTEREQETQLNFLDGFMIGGYDWRNDWAFVPFAGNGEGNNIYSAFGLAQVNVPLLLNKNFQLIPQYAVMFGTNAGSTQSTPLLDIFQAFHYSYGCTLGVKTRLGPILLHAAKASNDNSWRAYMSLGYRF